MKIHWNDELAECGTYHLCIDGRSIARLYDVRVKVEQNTRLRDWERKEILDEGNYEFSTCIDGFSHSHYTKVETLEEAKADAITWFANYYTRGIESAKESVKYCKKMAALFKGEN